MSTAFASAGTDTRRWQGVALGVGLVALLVCGLGALVDPAQFFRAYLAVYVYVLGLPLGCIAILMIYHLTGGAWGLLVRRILEASMRTLPLLAVGFLPIAFGLHWLYVWGDPAAVSASEDLQHKQFYLTPLYFWLRGAGYFIVWLALAVAFDRRSRAYDATGDPRLVVRNERLAGVGLVAFGISMTFAAVDWLMSLQPAFHSSIFGPVVASGMLLSGMAVAAVVLAWLADRPPLDRVASGPLLNDLGNLLFTFLVIWAYLVWFQYMLVWIANLPTDVVWYTARERGGWEWVAWALFGFGFAVPFVLLLFRNVKRQPAALGAVAGLILVAQLVYRYYQVMPAFTDASVGRNWMAPVMAVGLGGLWKAYFLWQLDRRPLLPRYDRDVTEAAHLRQVEHDELAREEAMSHG